MQRNSHAVPSGLRLTSSKDTPGASIPPGWEENPTAWPKRIGLAALSTLGFAIALYLMLYQFDVFPSVWDPWFDSYKVLHFTDPWPDASLGVLAYGAEIVLSFIGGRDRWRTMPWTTISYGFIVLSGAGVSMFLMIIQPTWVGAWCTLCLSSAAISLILCGWGVDEALASVQHLKRVRESGGSLWRAFLGLEDRRLPSETPHEVEPTGSSATEMLAGYGPRVLGVVFGVWLMMAPTVIGYSSQRATGNDHVIGPIIAGFSFLALWPDLRFLKWMELVAGAWVLAAPFFIDYEHVNMTYNLLPEVLHVCIGVILMALAFLGRTPRQRYGGGWVSVAPFMVTVTRENLQRPLP